MKVTTYARVGFGHFADDSDLERLDFRHAEELVIGVHPQVGGSVGAQVVLLTVQVLVPHVRSCIFPIFV